jgi:hypothetical protein
MQAQNTHKAFPSPQSDADPHHAQVNMAYAQDGARKSSRDPHSRQADCTCCTADFNRFLFNGFTGF